MIYRVSSTPDGGLAAVPSGRLSDQRGVSLALLVEPWRCGRCPDDCPLSKAPWKEQTDDTREKPAGILAERAQNDTEAK
jgi:hypothetical protein